MNNGWISTDGGGGGGGGDGNSVGTTVDKDLAVLNTAIDGDSTGVTISATPAGYVSVHVNQQGPYTLGDGVKTEHFYFSSDGGATAKTFATIAVGDTLYINPTITLFNLAAATDVINLLYEV